MHAGNQGSIMTIMVKLCTIFHPPGSLDSGEHETYHDAIRGKDRAFDVDEVLNYLSCSELVGFLPEDPAAAPTIFLHDDDLFFDSSTEEERGDINASDEQESISRVAQLASMTDWNLSK
jgi:hypothetical protein